MSDKTIIEKLAVWFGIDVDDASFKRAIRTYTDFHNVAQDITRALAAVTRAVISPLTNLVQLGSEATLTALRLGQNVVAMQEMQRTAQLSGVPVDSLTNAMERLGRSAYRVSQPGGAVSQQGRAFARLGISVYDSNKQLKDTGVLLPEVIDKLGQIKNTAVLDGVAFALMGRGIGALLPMIRQGGGMLKAVLEVVRDTGVVLGEGTAEAARKTAFWFDVLKMQVEGVKNQIGMGLLPLAYGLIGILYQWRLRNKELIQTKLDTWLGALNDVGWVLFHGLGSLGKAVEKVVGFFGGFDNIIKIILFALGGSFLAIVGAASVALLRFVATMALASIGPLIFGALLAVLVLIIQDLHSVDSLLSDIVNYKVDPESTPVVKFLTAVINYARAFRDVLRDIGRLMGIRWASDQLFDRKALTKMESDQYQAYLTQWAKTELGFDPTAGMGGKNPAPLVSPGGAGMPALMPTTTNNITVTVDGVSNPAEVERAALAGTQAALKASGIDARKTSLRNSAARSGAR